MDADLCSGKDRIVGARLARDGGAKPVKGVVALVLDTKHAGHAHSWAGRGSWMRVDFDYLNIPNHHQFTMFNTDIDKRQNEPKNLQRKNSSIL